MLDRQEYAAILLIVLALVAIGGITYQAGLFGLTGLTFVSGNESAVSTAGVSQLVIRIGGSTDLEQDFTGVQLVEFLDITSPLVQFFWDFDSAVLNLSEISLESITGELAVLGLGVPKIMFVEREDNTKVCIRDYEGASIVDFTENCTAIEEVAVDCDGMEQSGYTCEVYEDWFRVSGLNHTAVKAFEEGVIEETGNETEGNETGETVSTQVSGSISDVNATGISDLRIEINGSDNLSQNFTGILPVIFYDGTVPLVEFNFDFSNVLDLTQVSIHKNGGIITFSGVTFQTKTIYVDKGALDVVCVKDMPGITPESFSSNCDGYFEFPVSCNGEEQYYGYKCTDIGSYYKVEGLRHSGLMGLSNVTIASVSPSALGQGAYAIVDIAGAGFQSGATVYYNSSEITVINTTFVNSALLQVLTYVPLNATVNSTADVFVLNPDNSSANLSGAITVVSGPFVSARLASNFFLNKSVVSDFSVELAPASGIDLSTLSFSNSTLFMQHRNKPKSHTVNLADSISSGLIYFNGSKLIQNPIGLYDLSLLSTAVYTDPLTSSTTVIPLNESTGIAYLDPPIVVYNFNFPGGFATVPNPGVVPIIDTHTFPTPVPAGSKIVSMTVTMTDKGSSNLFPIPYTTRIGATVVSPSLAFWAIVPFVPSPPETIPPFFIAPPGYVTTAFYFPFVPPTGIPSGPGTTVSFDFNIPPGVFGSFVEPPLLISMEVDLASPTGTPSGGGGGGTGGGREKPHIWNCDASLDTVLRTVRVMSPSGTDTAPSSLYLINKETFNPVTITPIVSFSGIVNPGTTLVDIPFKEFDALVEKDGYGKSFIFMTTGGAAWPETRIDICTPDWPPEPKCEFVSTGDTSFFLEVKDVPDASVTFELIDSNMNSEVIPVEGTPSEDVKDLYDFGLSINLREYSSTINILDPITYVVKERESKKIVCKGETPKPYEVCLPCIPLTPPSFALPEQPKNPAITSLAFIPPCECCCEYSDNNRAVHATVFDSECMAVGGVCVSSELCKETPGFPPPGYVPPLPEPQPIPNPRPGPPPGVPPGPTPIPPTPIPPAPVPPTFEEPGFPGITPTTDLPGDYANRGPVDTADTPEIVCANEEWRVVPFDKKTYRAESELSAPITGFASFGDMDIPAGYDIVGGPFGINCDGDDFSITLSVPEACNPKSIRAYRMKDGKTRALTDVVVQQEELVCDGIPMREYRFNEMTSQRESIPADEFEIIPSKSMTVTPDTRSLSSKGYQVDFVEGGASGMIVRIFSPNESIRVPKNPSLSIMSVAQVEFDRPVPGDTVIKLVIPYRLEPGFEESSLSIYAFVGGRWIPLASRVDKDKKVVTAIVTDMNQFLENGVGLFAVMGIRCNACIVSKFEKVYDPGSRDAIILVHGLTSSSATWQPLIDDYVFNRQPWQIWTFDYPSYMTVDEMAKDLADAIQSHNVEFDRIYLVGHSLGGFIVQNALEIAVNNLAVYSFLPKVEKVILPGQPGEGSPAVEVYRKLFVDLVNSKTLAKIFDLNAVVIGDIKEGRQYNRIPGVEYYVIAGTRPYQFTLGYFTVTSAQLLNFTITNDGIITTNSAQYVGYAYINDTCYNYFEIDLTHTGLIDDATVDRIIERIIAKDRAMSDPDAAYLGYNQYVMLSVDACMEGESFVVVCEKMDVEKAAAPGGCNCGNGICGIDENSITCPVDCFDYYSVAGMCAFAPLLILVLLLLLALMSAYYLFRKRVQGKSPGNLYKSLMMFLILIIIAMIIIETAVCYVLPLFNLIMLVVIVFVLLVDLIIPFSEKEELAEEKTAAKKKAGKKSKKKK